MSKYVPLILTVVGTLAAALAFPTYVEAHPVVASVLVVASQVLHAALPSIFGGPASK